MNGARTTFMRRGYLLTALAAAVLLAASVGTASAQSVSFSSTTGTVMEGVAADDAQGRTFKVKIRRSAAPAPPTPDNVGTVSLITTPTDAAGAGWTLGITGNVTFDINNEAELTIIQAEDDTNWKSESLTIALQATGAGTTIGSPLMVKSMDNEVQPTASFSRTNVTLTENSSTKVNVKVGVGMGQTAPDAAIDTLTGATSQIQIQVTPANAFAAASAGGVATLRIGTATTDATNVANMPGVYALDDGTTTDINGVADLADGLALTIMANDDMSGFQDPQITLAFVAKSLENATTGNVLVGPPAMITIQSDEPVPTLSFSPTDVTVDEGGSVDTVLLAEGAHGSEVGMVKLMVEGDAMVDLYHGDSMLEEMDGYVMVDLGSSNSARLTAMSMSDPDLMDGDTAYKAWKLMEGATDGANIGEGYWFRVDVMGSTAVPALPLVGQLLLALFLMAGGSRLYRRRQG